MRTHNIGFYEDLTKIILQLSPNMHLIPTSGDCSSTLAVMMYSIVPHQIAPLAAV